MHDIRVYYIYTHSYNGAMRLIGPVSLAVCALLRHTCFTCMHSYNGAMRLELAHTIAQRTPLEHPRWYLTQVTRPPWLPSSKHHAVCMGAGCLDAIKLVLDTGQQGVLARTCAYMVTGALVWQVHSGVLARAPTW